MAPIFHPYPEIRMAINLESLSPRELDALISQAKKRRTTLSKRKPIAAVRKKLTQLARAEGYSVQELFGGPGAGAGRPARASKGAAKKAGKSASKIAPKYRNPDNPAETWTGRGKQPRWLAAYTGNGRSLDEFVIR
jgi:DNA-binding protein H-NS